MRWLGLFNLAYGALGLVSALYLGRADMVALCVWVMVSGFLLRTGVFRWLLARLRRQMS